MLKREAKRMGGNLRCEEPMGSKSADYRVRLVARDKAMPASLDYSKMGEACRVGDDKNGN